MGEGGPFQKEISNNKNRCVCVGGGGELSLNSHESFVCNLLGFISKLSAKNSHVWGDQKVHFFRALH